MDIELIGVIVLLAFGCELVDSTLGMGYGTTLTPVLLLMGYEPIEIVPAVLLSECVTGLLAGVCHHEFGNVDLRPGSRDFKITGVLTGFSLVGVLLAVGVAVNVPAWVVKLYIGLLVTGIGLAILKNHRRQMVFSWRRVAELLPFQTFRVLTVILIRSCVERLEFDQDKAILETLKVFSRQGSNSG